MASYLFKRYVWLADTIYRFGPISLAEIRDRWQRSILSDGRPLAVRTFHNHRTAIEELFDIQICCDERTNRYFIANSEDLNTHNITNWLLDSFSISNILNETQTIRNRIMVDDIPSAKGVLPGLLEAMRENRIIEATYQPFYANRAMEFRLRPLFVKLGNKRWYLYADKPDDRKIKVYALDRMRNAKITEDRFTFPADFDPDKYLAGTFGVAVYDDIKPCNIRIKAYGTGVDYMRTLPLHQSQREIETTENSATFEYRLAPTPEFYQAVLSSNLNIEVISPLSVRHEIMRIIEDMRIQYHSDNRCIIFLGFDGVMCTERHIEDLRNSSMPASDQYGDLFDPQSVENLRRIIDATEAAVVITSSWRLQGLDRMEALWRDRKMPGVLLDITGQCFKAEDYLPEIADALAGTEMLVGKGNEIRQWLYENAPEDCRYVIIDCGTDMLERQRPHLIRTDPAVGISRNDVDLAIKILNDNG